MKTMITALAVLVLAVPAGAATTPLRIRGIDEGRMQAWLNFQVSWKETPKHYLASDPATTRTGAFGLTHLDLDVLGYVDPGGRCDSRCFSDREWEGQVWLKPKTLSSRVALGNSREMQDYIAAERTALNAALIDGYYHPMDPVDGIAIGDAGALAAAETIGPLAFRTWAGCDYARECLPDTLTAGFGGNADQLLQLLYARIDEGNRTGDPMIREDAPALSTEPLEEERTP